ncbi:hypothetical protein EXS74_02630 [Candidatus Woesearchaeota archaeon]|nr:hypothetical protein [Candidatus Woesearchaeota archaeon]
MKLTQIGLLGLLGLSSPALAEDPQTLVRIIPSATCIVGDKEYRVEFPNTDREKMWVYTFDHPTEKRLLDSFNTSDLDVVHGVRLDYLQTYQLQCGEKKQK